MNNDKCKCGRPKRKGYSQCRECYLNYYATRTEKLCRGCDHSLPLDNFRKRPDGHRPRSRCMECEAKAAKKDRQLHPDKRRAIKKRYAEKHPEMIKKWGRRHSWRKMGLDPDIVEKFLSTHNGNCDICGLPPNGQAHAIDHCHKSGKFRGVLCSHCNSGLGYFRDNPDLLDKAKIYLVR
jgi:hypothetical protein